MPKKLFYTNGAARAEITELETQVSGLQESATTAETENTRLAGEVAALTTERDGAVAAMEETERSSTKANADLTAANGKLATFDAEVETAAAARFAGLGGDPLPESGNGNDPVSKKTMSEFNAMTPAARMTYVKNGGKLTE